MKKVLLSVGGLFAFLLAIGLGGTRAEAADVKGITLKSGIDIKKYDVTGDGKKDTVRIDCDKPAPYDEGCGDDWKITINNKVVYRDNKKMYTEYLTVVLYRISSKRIYLDIQENVGSNDDISSHAFYEYRGNTLKKVCDVYTPLAKQIYKFHFYIEKVAVSSKQIVVSYVNQFSASGYLFWKVSYRYEDNVWKRVGNTFQVTEQRKLTVNRKLTLYSTPGGKKKAVTLKKGQKIRINKLCLKNKKTYMQVVMSNGKKGWFISPNKILPERYYFKEVVFAG